MCEFGCSSLTAHVLLNALENSVCDNLAHPSPGNCKLPAVHIPVQKLTAVKPQVLLECMFWHFVTGAANLTMEPRCVLGFFLAEVSPQHASTNMVSHLSERAAAMSMFAIPRRPLRNNVCVAVISAKRESNGFFLGFSDGTNGIMTSLQVTRFVDGQLGTASTDVDIAKNSMQMPTPVGQSCGRNSLK